MKEQETSDKGKLAQRVLSEGKLPQHILNELLVFTRDRKENKDKAEARQRRYREELSPIYVKNLLAKSLGIDRKDITPHLIELKTSQIKLSRLIKETQGGCKTSREKPR